MNENCLVSVSVTLSVCQHFASVSRKPLQLSTHVHIEETFQTKLCLVKFGRAIYLLMTFPHKCITFIIYQYLNTLYLYLFLFYLFVLILYFLISLLCVFVNLIFSNFSSLCFRMLLNMLSFLWDIMKIRSTGIIYFMSSMLQKCGAFILPSVISVNNKAKNEGCMSG